MSQTQMRYLLGGTLLLLVIIIVSQAAQYDLLRYGPMGKMMGMRVNKAESGHKFYGGDPAAIVKDAVIYKNDQYGFKMELPSFWKGFTAESRKVDGTTDTIYICIPTKDKKYTTTECKAGFAAPLAISVWTKGQLNALTKEDSPVPVLGSNSRYSFSYNTWQDAPSDLKGDMRFDVPIYSFTAR